MLLYFNKNGQLLERLDNYGFPARAGSTNFKIMAYFEDIDVEAYSVALIKLVKPDLNQSNYPLLFMTQKNLIYNHTIENSEYFKENGGPNEDGSYPIFELDFTNFAGSQDVVILLDTKGMWKAYISLYMLSKNISVMGEVKFLVEDGLEDDDGQNVGLDTLMRNVALQFSEKVDAHDTILVVDSFPEDLSLYEEGQVLFTKDDNKFYQVGDGGTVSEIDLGYSYVEVEDEDYVIPPEDR